MEHLRTIINVFQKKKEKVQATRKEKMSFKINMIGKFGYFSDIIEENWHRQIFMKACFA